MNSYFTTGVIRKPRRQKDSEKISRIAKPIFKAKCNKTLNYIAVSTQYETRDKFLVFSMFCIKNSFYHFYHFEHILDKM